ncbi:hypothetical protein [Mucilaginibacter gynuensis]
MKKLQRKVASLLKTELKELYTITIRGIQIEISIPSTDFETRLGLLLQRIQQIIEAYFPSRQDDLLILIRDTGNRYANTFKIWKS